MFRHSTKLILAGLTTAAVMATGGCSKKPDSQGSASVGVQALSLAQDVKSMTVAVSGGGIPTPMTMPLFKQADGNWKALVNHIPAGSNRTFAAKAYDAANLEIYNGSAGSVTINKDQIADVIIVLQENGAAKDFANHAPVVDSLTVSSQSVVYGDKVAYTLTAHDPDAADVLTLASFAANPSCGTFGTPTLTTDAQGHLVWAALWTAPGAPATSCQLNMTITDPHGAQAMAAVTISVSAGIDVGGARVSTLVESYPLITNVTANPTVIAPAGTTTLNVVATEPDGKAMTFSWLATGCTGTFDDNTKQSPVFTLTQTPAPASCTFGVTVTGPTNTPTNGTPQALHTSGSLTVNVGTTPSAAPLGGVVIDLTSQSQETANGNDTVTLFIQAHDSNPAASLQSAVWTPSNGSVGSRVDGVGTSQVVWTAPAVMGPQETVTVLVTDSQAATASYVFTFKAAFDPCAAANSNGVDCSDGNPCTIGDKCQNQVCVGGAPKSCAAIDSCHKDGVCDQVTGQCSAPVWGDGHVCADKDLCTTGSACTAGVCAGSAKTCQAQDVCHAAGTCSLADGSCSNPAGNENGDCSTSGLNADKCATASTCQAGACLTATSKACTTPGSCHTTVGAACDSATGNCSYPSVLDGTVCSGADLCLVSTCSSGTCGQGVPTSCVASDACHVAGSCVSPTGCPAQTVKDCAWGTSCSLPSGDCKKTCPAPKYAKQFGVASLSGLAVDPAGNQLVVSSLYNTVNFNGASLTSLGGSDIVLAKLDPATGAVAWTKQFSGSTADEAGTADQAASGVAVGHTLIGVIGTYSGGLQVNSTTHLVGGADSVDFFMVTDLSGVGQRAIPIDTKGGSIQTIAGNPASDDFVLCGYASGSMTALGLTATYATGDTGADIVIAKVDGTTGIQRWAHQYTGVGTAFCNAVAMDANGVVYASGTFNGTSTGTGLPTTYTSAVLAIWVAEFDTTGAISVIKSYTDNIGKQAIKGLAIDSNGDVAITGALKNHVAFGGTTLTVTGTNTDGFAAKLKKSDLTSLWARSWGDSAAQEADGVAFTSVGDVVIVGAMNGTIAQLGTGSFASAGQSDAYWAKFNGLDGTNVCAGRYGESLYGQSAALVAISSAATGAQQDMVNIVGGGQGTFDFAPGMTFTSPAVPNAFVLQLNP